jgi:ArsR family transcriptional regulator, arsenate/arsenite/antimonite-responsive transcriptional repressor
MGGNVTTRRAPTLSDTVCCPAISDRALSGAEAVRLAEVFAALGDPVRLRLLSIVASGGEVCSCNLEEPLGKSQPTISHHTKVLAEAGLITGEKRGRWMWWRVVPEQLDALRDALAQR